jgi:dTDP-4-amino-4,6-dideoxygalactose transaminase
MNNVTHKALRASVDKISFHSHFLPASRVSWSLFAILSIKKTGAEQVIAMPSFICQSIVAAVILAKWKIKFLDIDYKDGMVNYDDCLLEFADTVDAVLFVHLLGNRNKIGGLQKVCNRSGILLIEDSAQFYTHNSDEYREDDLTYVRLISFGSTKLVDAGGGALILSNDSSLLSEISLFEKKYNFFKKLFVQNHIATFNKEFYLIKDELPRRQDIQSSLQKILKFYMPAISMEVNFNNTLIEKINNGISTLQNKINLRQSNLEKYLESFQDIDIIPVNSKSSIPWRASFRIEGFSYRDQQTLSESLRGQGFDVSNWYLPGHWYLNDTKELDITLSNTVKLSQEILQFWVDREYDNLHFQTLKKLLVNKLHNEK